MSAAWLHDILDEGEFEYIKFFNLLDVNNLKLPPTRYLGAKR
jgi:hypothetical protein